MKFLARTESKKPCTPMLRRLVRKWTTCNFLGGRTTSRIPSTEATTELCNLYVSLDYTVKLGLEFTRSQFPSFRFCIWKSLFIVRRDYRFVTSRFQFHIFITDHHSPLFRSCSSFPRFITPIKFLLLIRTFPWNIGS